MTHGISLILLSGRIQYCCGNFIKLKTNNHSGKFVSCLSFPKKVNLMFLNCINSIESFGSKLICGICSVIKFIILVHKTLNKRRVGNYSIRSPMNAGHPAENNVWKKKSDLSGGALFKKIPCKPIVMCDPFFENHGPIEPLL